MRHDTYTHAEKTLEATGIILCLVCVVIAAYVYYNTPADGSSWPAFLWFIVGTGIGVQILETIEKKTAKRVVWPAPFTKKPELGDYLRYKQFEEDTSLLTRLNRGIKRCHNFFFANDVFAEKFMLLNADRCQEIMILDQMPPGYKPYNK